MSHGSPDLLERFQAGDAAALTELVDGMGPRLKGYFLRQGAQDSTAEDLVQNVFLRVIQGIERYQPAGRQDAFLLRIARNLWIDHRRRKRPPASTDDVAEPIDEGLAPLDLADLRDRAELLREALRSCDEDTRELLELAVLQRLPYREVSVILDIPVGTVKSRVFYSLRRLRETVQALDPAADLESRDAAPTEETR